MWPFSKATDLNQDLPDLTGKVVIVTGGNANIGLYTIQHLARKGAKVYMGARNEDRAKEAIALLQSEGLGPGNGEVKWLDLDLADPHKTKNAGEHFLQLESRLDILVHNAAMPISPYSKSHNDIQDVITVNHISPFILTQTLLPTLRRTAEDPNNDVRIVVVSYSIHVKFGLDCVSSNIHAILKDVRFRNKEDLNREFGETWSPALKRYALSKLCGILFTNELQRRFTEENIPILAICLNPGAVRTDRTEKLFDNWNFIVRGLYNLLLRWFSEAPQAARTVAFAASSAEIRNNAEGYKAAYLEPPGKLGKSSEMARNPDLAKELWSITEELVREFEI